MYDPAATHPHAGTFRDVMATTEGVMRFCGFPRSAVLLVLVAASAPVYSQTRTFDIASFSPPEGWQTEARQPAQSPASALPRASAPAVQAARPALGASSRGALTGVWMGFKQLTGSLEPDARWLMFFDDGQSMDTMPKWGLVGFDRLASQSAPTEKGYWSTYTFSGGTGVINTKIPTKIRAETADRIKLDDLWVYYRCVSVDGLRLEGSWTSHSDSNDPELKHFSEGRRPIFRFARDGRFVDEGVFIAYLGNHTNDRDDRAGTGTYEIRDFTLLLHYADGRQKQVAFTGVLGNNPASDDKIVYIGRAQFHKIAGRGTNHH